ncbi:MAG: acyclic terpene utilization AtuA family protein [Clostridia bacterium]|nr:acyclic terpene utilization AtuA family protein [Clostridia bacterium]
MKIVALNGLLGYGYSEQALRKVFEEKVDYLGVDAGSTDPGPYYLGSGNSFTDRTVVKRDLSLALSLAIENQTPFIIGTAGGAGSRVHVEWLKEIILELAKERNLSFKMGFIYSDVSNDYMLAKLNEGKVLNLSDEFPLSGGQIEQSKRIVSQVGVSPIINILKQGVDIVLVGRCFDTAIYAAPCIMHGFPKGLAFHVAKIMECGAMCSEPTAAADVMQAYIHGDSFELEPANPLRKCTVERVAAHTMYEQANPYLIYESDGGVNVEHCTYEQVTPRRVRVRGSEFTETQQKTLKIEGVKSLGFRTICLAGIMDDRTIKRIDDIFETVKGFLREQVASEEYSIRLRKYGGVPDLGIVLDVIAKTQELADSVCALARAKTLHCDYPENEITEKRKSTAGNLAMPFSPFDIHVGEVFEFSIFHLVAVDDLNETVKTEITVVKNEKIID